LTKVKAHRWLLKLLPLILPENGSLVDKQFGYKKLQWLESPTSYCVCCCCGLVVVLPIVTVASSVLVAAVSAKHAILAIANSSMANRMLVGVMLLNVACGNAAAK
jgi:hypothetical protein